jgi:hypothetical protein
MAIPLLWAHRDDEWSWHLFLQRKSDAIYYRSRKKHKTKSLKPKDFKPCNGNEKSKNPLEGFIRGMGGKGTEDDELQRAEHDPCKPVLSHSPFAQSPESMMTSTTSICSARGWNRSQQLLRLIKMVHSFLRHLNQPRKTTQFKNGTFSLRTDIVARWGTKDFDLANTSISLGCIP